MARDIEVLHRAYPNLDAMTREQLDGDRGAQSARQTLSSIGRADRLDEIIRQSAERRPDAVRENRTVALDQVTTELALIMPAARRQAATVEERTRIDALRKPALAPAHVEAVARMAALEGDKSPDRLLAALRARGADRIDFDRVPGASALDRTLAYREGMERSMAIQTERAPSMLALCRGSTVGDLAKKVPAGRASIPDGAEQIVVMNGSRLYEIRHGGEWVVQKTDPQGMLPHGVYRLDTATAAKPDDGARNAGSILHVGAKGVYQAHGNGVARHDPARFEQKPAIGETATVTYANGRATLANRGPDLPAKGRSI